MSNARQLAANLVPNLDYSKIPTDGIFTGRNVIVNGEMMVDQRNNGAHIIPTSLYYQLTLDRWAAGVSQASKVRFERGGGSVTPPAGFKTYLAMTQEGSTYTPTASDTFAVDQYIEGHDVAKFDFGKSTAKNLKLSFWVRSNVTGTYGIYIVNKDTNRIFVNSYTINAADTWEHKIVDIIGDTTGTWLTNNDTGMRVGWFLSAGADRMTTANAWNAAQDYAVTGQVNVLGTSGGYLYLTGCQLEAEQATTFEHVPFNVTFQKCCRYFYKSSTYSLALANASSTGYSFRQERTQQHTFPVIPRTWPSAPTVSLNVSIVSLSSGGVIAATGTDHVTVMSDAYGPDLPTNNYWYGGYSMSAELS